MLMIVSYGETRPWGYAVRLVNGIVVVEERKLPSMDTPSLWGQLAQTGSTSLGRGEYGSGAQNSGEGASSHSCKNRGFVLSGCPIFSVLRHLGGGPKLGGGSGVIRGILGGFGPNPQADRVSWPGECQYGCSSRIAADAGAGELSRGLLGLMDLPNLSYLQSLTSSQAPLPIYSLDYPLN